MLAKGFQVDQSDLGKVYYPAQGVEIPGRIVINYVEYPWITCFEVEGVEIAEKGEK